MTGGYDFSVSKTRVLAPGDKTGVSPAYYDLTAHNRGIAPVSVIVSVHQASTRNLSADRPLPVVAVVPPMSERKLVRFGPETNSEPYRFSSSQSWSIGDHTAEHNSGEHYRLPFGAGITAYANVSDRGGATPYTRNAVLFSLPAGTPVLAARGGLIARMKDGNRIDILHDDMTIATYGHLGTIAPHLQPGKSVSPGDVLGTAGAPGHSKDAFVQITVWKPQLPETGGGRDKSRTWTTFELVSFPLLFCDNGSDRCGVLTQSQAVSRNIPHAAAPPASGAVHGGGELHPKAD